MPKDFKEDKGDELCVQLFISKNPSWRTSKVYIARGLKGEHKMKQGKSDSLFLFPPTIHFNVHKERNQTQTYMKYTNKLHRVRT